MARSESDNSFYSECCEIAMSELDIPEEFIQENRNSLSQFMPISHKRGPYTKQELENRRNEVYRYHFEYGYSARKIAELLKINRNTINGDITYWYSKIAKSNDIQYESTIYPILERLDVQRTRIREYLDQAKTISEKITIEKSILDIDSKISQINEKLHFSSQRILSYVVESLNHHFEQKNDKTRYVGIHEKLAVTKNSKIKIDKIILEDKKNLWSRQN